MILTKEYEFDLTKGYDKVQYLSPAIHESFVFLAHREAGCDIFVHCNLYGKTQFELPFEDMVDTLSLITPSDALLLLTRKNYILHIDLNTHGLTYIPFEFMRESTELSSIECFSDTKMFCVAEWGLYNDNRMKLSYFTLPLSRNMRPVVEFESEDDDWTHEYLIKRVNNRSMMAWFKARHDDQFEIRIFQIINEDEQLRGQMRVVKSQQSLASMYGLNQCQTALLTLWQTVPGQFMLITLNSRSDQAKNSNDKILINSNYILETQRGILRECKFVIPKLYSDLTLDHCGLGYYSMIRTYAFDNSRAKQTPVYFINNITQELLAEQTWECSYLFKDTVPGYDGSLLVSSQYQNADVHRIKVSLKSLTDPKMIGLHLLLEMFQDFDQNFLQEALQYLPNPSEQR